MQKLHFSIVIAAPRQKVWHSMLDQEHYREWTKAFSPGSFYKGDWNKGSKIIFYGPNPETGELGGMIGRIAESKPNEFLSIEYVGIISGDTEDTTSPEAKKWQPAFENYTYKEIEGGTELLIDIDVADGMAEEFGKMWPKALQDLKKLAESS